MKKVVFHLSDELDSQVAKAIQRWGFINHPEFFRFAAIEFLRNDARFMPADDVLKDHAKAIQRVKVRQSIRQHRMSWYDEGREQGELERMGVD